MKIDMKKVVEMNLFNGNAHDEGNLDEIWVHYERFEYEGKEYSAAYFCPAYLNTKDVNCLLSEKGVDIWANHFDAWGCPNKVEELANGDLAEYVPYGERPDWESITAGIEKWHEIKIDRSTDDLEERYETRIERLTNELRSLRFKKSQARGADEYREGQKVKLTLLVYREEGRLYFATCPELEGCCAQGETYETASSRLRKKAEEMMNEKKRNGESRDILGNKEIIFTTFEIDAY